MKHVTTLLTGGLGNQFFQYAAGYALARKWHADLVLDTSSYSMQDRQYKLDFYDVPAQAVTKQNLHERKKRLLLKLKRQLPPFYIENDFSFDASFFETRPPVVLQGYFTSPLYFFGYEADIKRLFTYRQDKKSVADLASVITAQKKSVCVHIRRGDYLSPAFNSVHTPCSPAYYETAMHLMRSLLGGDIVWYVFSDDIAWCKNHFSGLGNVELVSDKTENEHEDLHLMSLCRHHVIANSTFSWWGAWLGDHDQQVVVAPRQWFSDEALRTRNTCDLFPKDWILV